MEPQYYPGYPGQPSLQPRLIEQSPGLGHPFLPGKDTHIDMGTFLWSGAYTGEEEALQGEPGQV